MGATVEPRLTHGSGHGESHGPHRGIPQRPMEIPLIPLNHPDATLSDGCGIIFIRDVMVQVHHGFNRIR